MQIPPHILQVKRLPDDPSFPKLDRFFTPLRDLRKLQPNTIIGKSDTLYTKHHHQNATINSSFQIPDVIAFVADTGELESTFSAKQNKELYKRQLTLKDTTEHEDGVIPHRTKLPQKLYLTAQSLLCFQIPLTLWEKDARQFDANRSPIIEIRDAKVSFHGGGVSINETPTSQLQVTSSSRTSRNAH